MTVSSSVNKVIYSGNSATVLFPVNYYFLENSHLKVILRAADGTETVQALTTNYTVTGAGNPAGGSITMFIAPLIGTTLTILRNVPATQETDYLANDPFPAESHERALDKLTMLTQENEEIASRSIQIPQTDPVTTNIIVPKISDRASRLLGFGSNGSVAVSGSTIAQVDAAVATITSIASAPSGNSAGISHIATGTGATPTTVQTKLRETLSVKDFGAVGDNAADDTAAIQAAIDATSAAGGGELFFPPGNYKVTDTLNMKPKVWLVGAGFNDTSTSNRISRLSFTNSGAAKLGCIFVSKPDYVVNHCQIRHLFISCDAGWETIIRNKESHWFRLNNCYLSGAPTVAAIWLGATLYTIVEDNIFSLSNGVCIDAQETNFDITYYGTNWSSFRRNNIFCGKEAFIGTGTLDFSENNIESGSGNNCVAKIRFVGPSTSNFTFNHNYFELGNISSPTHPLRILQLETSCQGEITANAIYGDNSVRALNSVCFDLNAQRFIGQITGNQIIRFHTALAAGSGTSDYLYANNFLQAVQVEFAGGYETQTTSVSGGSAQGVGTLATKNDLLRINKIDRSMFQEATIANVLLARGENIVFNVSGTPTLSYIADAGLFPGTRVFIHAVQPIIIEHNATTSLYAAFIRNSGYNYTTASLTVTGGGGIDGALTATVVSGRIDSVAVSNAGSGYTGNPSVTLTGDGLEGSVGVVRQAPFNLAKGANCTIPAGRVMEFVVDFTRVIREVGDYSARL